MDFWSLRQFLEFESGFFKSPQAHRPNWSTTVCTVLHGPLAREIACGRWTWPGACWHSRPERHALGAAAGRELHRRRERSGEGTIQGRGKRRTHFAVLGRRKLIERPGNEGRRRWEWQSLGGGALGWLRWRRVDGGEGEGVRWITRRLRWWQGWLGTGGATPAV
jgi:hypothetical protein